MVLNAQVVEKLMCITVTQKISKSVRKNNSSIKTTAAFLEAGCDNLPVKNREVDLNASSKIQKF